MPEDQIKVGDTLWCYSTLFRFGGGWSSHVIGGETSRSWIINKGEYNEKIVSKKDLTSVPYHHLDGGRLQFYTQAGKDTEEENDKWMGTWSRHIECKIAELCRSRNIPVLKLVLEVLDKNCMEENK